MNANQSVIRYLAHHDQRPVTLESPGSVADPYMTLGSHPDIVSRIWDELGAKIAPATRVVFCRNPALIQPTTGIVFGLAMGTQYGLQLPEGMAAEAVRAGAKTHNRWSGGPETDIRETLGPDWIFGGWLTQELEWCRKAFQFYGDL
jgi:hypothetical protein